MLNHHFLGLRFKTQTLELDQNKQHDSLAENPWNITHELYT